MGQWAQGHLLYVPYYLLTLEWQNINPRSTQLSDLSMPTSVTWQPALLPPVCVCRAMALFNLPAEWYCPSFNGTCPVKDMSGWNDSVFLGISHVSRRYKGHLLFPFLLFKIKNRDSWSGLSSWTGIRVSLTAELLESRSLSLARCCGNALTFLRGWVRVGSRAELWFSFFRFYCWAGSTVPDSPLPDGDLFLSLSLKDPTLHLCSLASVLGGRVGVRDKMGLGEGVRNSVNAHYLMIIFSSESLFLCF